MTNKQQFDLFVHYASLAFFASAWADQQEENGHSLSGEIMDQTPIQLIPQLYMQLLHLQQIWSGLTLSLLRK